DRAYATFLGDGPVRDGTDLALAVDIGHYDIRVALGTRDGDLVAVKKESAYVDKERRPTLKRVVAMAAELLKQSQASVEDIRGVGLGVPGPIDLRSGMI